MAAVILQASYPYQSIKKVAEIFKKQLSKNPMPDYMTQKIYVKSTLEGRKVIAVHEVDNSHVGEVLDMLNAMMIHYHDVPGYSYTIDQWSAAEDVRQLILS